MTDYSEGEPTGDDPITTVLFCCLTGAVAFVMLRYGNELYDLLREALKR